MRRFFGFFSVTIMFGLLFTPVAVDSLRVNDGQHRAFDVNTETTSRNSGGVLRNSENPARKNPSKRLAQANEQRDVRLQQNSNSQNNNESRDKACEDRSRAIEKIMDRQLKRGEKYIDLFSTVSERVQDFYKNHPTKVNQEEFKAAVSAADKEHEDAVAALKSLKNSRKEFNCEDDNPKELVNSYRNNLKELLDILKNYKNSVVDLITVVQNAVTETEASSGNTTNSNPFSSEEDSDEQNAPESTNQETNTNER